MPVMPGVEVEFIPAGHLLGSAYARMRIGGADGGTANTPAGETLDVPGFPVDVVSTLGAGDVFHGALLACLDRGLPLRDALVRANACAALSCRALDGRSAIPTIAEVSA